VSARETITLSTDEDHYVRHVLRLAAGANLRVFDGRGREWDASILESGKAGIRVAVGGEVSPAPEPPVAITLALSILKSEFMDDAVRDAAMIGATAIQPLRTARTAINAPADASRLVARWQRIALASVKQSGRAVLPVVETPQLLATWLAAKRDDGGLKIILTEPRGRIGQAGQAGQVGQAADRDRATGTEQRATLVERSPDFAAWLTRARGRGAYVLVGPEGGWTADERASACAAGFLPWTVSPRVLRADATPVAALAVLLYDWEMRM
jgi:16S rRNA (uracil1498-N3)-methyltransferase